KKFIKIAQEIDFSRVMEVIGDMSAEDLMKLSRVFGKKSRKKDLPVGHGDFYEVSRLLTDEERALQLKVREFMQREVGAIVNEYWLRGEFPHDLIRKFAALGLGGLTYKGYGCPGKSYVLEGIIAHEIARVDVSMCTFLGVQSGLAMGSIYLCGS